MVIRLELMKMDLAICKICKEPIWNFLCTECLAKDIKEALPDHLVKGFSKFHHNFKRYFYNKNHGTECVHCKKPSPVSVCPYCYLNEAGNWMRGVDQIMAKRLLRLIPPFRHKSEFPKANVSMEFTNAITELENEKGTEGVCDRCGEFSENLKQHGEDGLVCEVCRGL